MKRLRLWLKSQHPITQVIIWGALAIVVIVLITIAMSAIKGGV